MFVRALAALLLLAAMANAQILGGFTAKKVDDVPSHIYDAVRTAAFEAESNKLLNVCSYQTQVVAGVNHAVTYAVSGSCTDGELARVVIYEKLGGAGLEVGEIVAIKANSQSSIKK